MYHQAGNGAILHMSQRRDSEQELGKICNFSIYFSLFLIFILLVTCGINTPILFWDCDVVEPV